MAFASLRQFFARSAAAAAVALAAFAPAHAGLVVATWDPAYGPDFPNLGWRGEVKVDVPAACLALGFGDHAASGICAPMTVQSAKVDLYDLSNPLVTLETLDFTGLLSIDGVSLFGPGDVAGFWSNSSFFVPSTSAPAQFSGFHAEFSIWMDSCADCDLAAVYMDWQLNDGDCRLARRETGNPSLPCSGSNDADAFPPLLTFTIIDTVPEPASVALTGVALLGMAGLRRRRHR